MIHVVPLRFNVFFRIFYGGSFIIVAWCYLDLVVYISIGGLQ